MKGDGIKISQSWNEVIDLLRSEKCWLFLHGIALIGIFYSRALTTISLALIVIVGFLGADWSRFRAFYKDRFFIPFALIFLSGCFSILISDNIEAALTSIRIQLPFLILPMVYFLKGKVSEDFIFHLHSWVIIITVVVGLPVCAYALKHYPDMLDLLSMGQPIPTPIEHVKYSMFNAYAIVSGLVILLYSRKTLDSFMKMLVLCGTLFLIFLIHLLAVRTGIVIFYCSLFVFLILTFVKYKTQKITWVFLASIILFPIITYKTVPSVKQKIGYVIYDWNQYRQGNGMAYSDSERFMLYRSGFEVWKKNWLVGVGFGDVRQEVAIDFAQRYERNSGNKLPHNQYLLFLCGSGLIGLLIFLIGFYLPFIKSANLGFAGILIGFLYLNYSLSFLVENSLERSMSVAYFLLIAMPLLYHISMKHSNR